MKPLSKEVTYEQLSDKMIIRAYSGFSMKFQHMSPDVCHWLKHNFQGTQVIIKRAAQKKQVLIEEIEEGDSLYRIFQFPQSRRRLTIVTGKLIKELQGRGFLSFIVALATRTISTKKEKQQVAVRQVNTLVQKVQQTVSLKEEATGAVEDMLDNARKDKISSTEVIAFVEQINQKSSAEAITAMVSLKASDQTYAHCVDVGAIFESTYFEIKRRNKEKSIFVDKKEAMLASFLHDFGKSKIPKEILDSRKRFERDGPEMKMMNSHPTKSAELLTHMGLPNHIVNMAHYHHVKLDTSMKSSYPANVNYSDVLMETRLLAIVDIYQALVGKRSYKKSWSPPSAVRYLDALAGVEFDLATWEDFLGVIGKYPQSSLVELSDNSIGFVMSVPTKDLERPQVVIVRNGAGEDLTHNPLIDLEEERDLSISKDLDVQDVFGDKALDIFMKIQAS